jgi:hypothetical protein
MSVENTWQTIIKNENIKMCFSPKKVPFLRPFFFLTLNLHNLYSCSIEYFVSYQAIYYFSV